MFKISVQYDHINEKKQRQPKVGKIELFEEILKKLT